MTEQHTPAVLTDISANPFKAEVLRRVAAERDRLKALNVELVEALNAILAKFESDPDDLGTMDDGIDIVRAALTKAKGEAP